MTRRSLLSFVTLLLLWAVVSQINHYLAEWHLYFYVGALYVTLSALRLTVREGYLVTAFGGLLCDANTPVPFGTHLLLFTLIHTFILRIRSRIPGEQTATQVIIAFISNLVLYLALTLVLAIGPLQIGHALPRLLWDLLLSQLFLLLIAPWFFSLQTALIRFEPLTRRRRF